MRDISGTSIIAVFPCFTASSMSRMNTEVLPLPVTPRRSAHFGASSFISFSRPLNTPCCFGENTISDGLSDFPSVFSSRNT